MQALGHISRVCTRDGSEKDRGVGQFLPGRLEFLSGFGRSESFLLPKETPGGLMSRGGDRTIFSAHRHAPSQSQPTLLRWENSLARSPQFETRYRLARSSYAILEYFRGKST